MNNGLIFLYKIKPDQTICIYRVYGDTPVITLPDFIDTYPVCEIGPYCFSSSQRVPKDVQTSSSIENMFELCGNQIESIYIPDSVKIIGSHAFYNCRSLKEISIPSSLQEIGCDIFLNDSKLHDISIRDCFNTPTVLKNILHQISWDVDIHYTDLSLFFPEYYEVYDEIGPAHFFGMNIEGEGFRLRQTVKNGIVDLDEYDSIFEKLCVEESVQTLLHFALTRFIQKPELYKAYILSHQKEVTKYKKLSLSLIEKLLSHDALTKESLDILISQSDSVEQTTQFIAWKKKYFPIKKESYSFEDF